MNRLNSRILFASPHCLVDFASGAAVTTRDALQLLARHGFECRAFCASKLDGDGQLSAVSCQLSAVRTQRVTISGERSVDMIHGRVDAVSVHVFPTLSTRIDDWAPDEPQAMLAAFERVLGDFRPDVLLIYGGHPVAQEMMKLAKVRRIPVVFSLHNFAYDDARLFRNVDHVVVPSEFSRAWYERTLGLKCHVLPYAIDWARVESRGLRVESKNDSGGVDSDAQPSTLNSRRFLTFVNPQEGKRGHSRMA